MRKTNYPTVKLLTLLLLFVSSNRLFSATGFVSFSASENAICIAGGHSNTIINYDNNEYKGVVIAIGNLKKDFKAVTGIDATISQDGNTSGDANITIGTIGKSRAIDALIKDHRIDGKSLKGKREKFIITTIDGKMVIAGSDKRGTIYGIYELSRQMGVSPWYDWADVPIIKHHQIYVKSGVYTDGEPAVRYRGIFLNDEAPCLTSWVKNTYGTNYGDHRFYARVFELLLRLKANFIWPAMWGWAFYADDALNGPTADEMGIIVGTSHHEPMCRSQKEWHNHSDNPNAEAQDTKSRVAAGGKWDYSTNKAALDAFWAGGVARNKNTEDLITIGMRGDGDMAMSDNQNLSLMESIIKNQREIIARERGKNAKDVPQVWALYKEVMDYYDAGLKVPDDVTLMLCDDNWGNVRRVPTAKDRNRKGGWGLYYHVDYVGAPRNSKWLNVTPVQNMWEQLTLADQYGINRLWILNVGDLKPMEYPISLFMDMAWNPRQYNAANILDHTTGFCTEQFGADQAEEAARILNLYSKYNGRCTAEMLDATTYNLETGEWKKVVDEYNQLETDALRQFTTLKPEYQDAYRELILFPVQAMANIYNMYYAQAMNNALYQQGDSKANQWAELCKKYFVRDSMLCAQYNHDIAGGKWNGMMTQKHIGYKIWNDNFRKDTLPHLDYVSRQDNGHTFTGADGYVVMEAEHYDTKTDAANAKWTCIPYMGRTLSGMALMPYTAATDKAALNYRFTGIQDDADIRVHIITKSTLDFLNKGGLCYEISIDGGSPIKVNFNKDLNEKPENIYEIYYPIVARRIVEKIVPTRLPKTKDGLHTLSIHPLDPGIVIEKIVIDGGGYKPQYLFGEESKN